jgi:hypothetical protein
MAEECSWPIISIWRQDVSSQCIRTWTTLYHNGGPSADELTASRSSCYYEQTLQGTPCCVRVWPWSISWRSGSMCWNRTSVSLVSLANSHSLQSKFCHGGLQVLRWTCFLPNLTKFCSTSCFSLFFLSWFIFPCLLVLVYFRVFYPSFVSEYSLFIFCPSFSLLVQFYFYILPPFFSNTSVFLFRAIYFLFLFLLFT